MAKKKNNNLMIWGIIGGAIVVIAVVVAVILLNRPSKDNGGSGNSNSGSSSQQANVPEGKNSFEDITFDIPDDFEKVKDDFFQLINEKNGIRVELYVKKDFGGTLSDYIEKDENSFYPVQSSKEEKNINGHTWYLVKGRDGDYLYYAENGKDKYMIAISPLFAQRSKVQELIDTIEKSLVFKK